MTLTPYDADIPGMNLARQNFIDKRCKSWPKIYKTHVPLTTDKKYLESEKIRIENMMMEDMAAYREACISAHSQKRCFLYANRVNNLVVSLNQRAMKEASKGLAASVFKLVSRTEKRLKMERDLLSQCLSVFSDDDVPEAMKNCEIEIDGHLIPPHGIGALEKELNKLQAALEKELKAKK